MIKPLKKNFDHELGLKIIERNSLDGRLTRDEGSPYHNVEKNI